MDNGSLKNERILPISPPRDDDDDDEQNTSVGLTTETTPPPPSSAVSTRNTFTLTSNAKSYPGIDILVTDSISMPPSPPPAASSSATRR